MTEYEQGSSPVFYVTFADANGEPASVTSGTITIRHRYGSSTTTDVNDATLTQLDGSTYYYSGWSIPSAADRTVYDVRYIGAYTDGTVAIGNETFYVIARSFFDKTTGGGITKTFTKRDTWTKEEKDNLLETIADLARKHNIETSLSQSFLSESRLWLSELKSKLNGLSDSMASFSDNFVNLSDKISKNANKKDIELSIKYIEEAKSASKKAIEIVELQQSAIDETSRKIRELTAVNLERENIVSKKIAELSESISGLGTEIRNEKLSCIISELDDLKVDSTELKKLVVMSAPREVLESMKNGITETNS